MRDFFSSSIVIILRMQTKLIASHDVVNAVRLINKTSITKIPPPWKRWIAENKMLQVPDDCIVGALMQKGISEDVAERQLASVTKTHSYKAGIWVAQRYLKLESLLEVYRQLSSLSGDTIERRTNLSRAEFLEKYYAANRPVIITDIMKGWKALSLWTPEYLKEQLGEMIVEIMAGREADKRYQLNLEAHKVKIRFADYIDRVTNGGASNDYYLVANNFFFQQQEAKRLLDDVKVFPEYLNNNERLDDCLFWFGPAGTITPLHHDEMNILIAQVLGRKKITLVPPYLTHLVYNETGVYSEVDVENPDFHRHPRFRDVKPLQIVLEPGEVLFIPVGWWHHVRALDISISVSFINFIFPNTYHWKNPHLHR